MDGLTTQELVDRLERSGLRVSVVGLRQDVHRGLISPLMPSDETPGRGTPARWSPMSVWRARRKARLRKRGVNGKVLPLLLFLADGWGWVRILPGLQEACAKSWELDRRHMGRPNRVRSRADLVDNASEADHWLDQPDWHAIRDFRRWLYTANWFGTPEPGSSMAPLLTTTVPEAMGLQLDPEARVAAESNVHRVEAARAALELSAAELSGWLATLDLATVARGRSLFWVVVGATRRAKGSPDPSARSTNPLTMGGMTAHELAAYFRGETGRLTPAQVLSICIAQAMVMAKLEEVASPP